METILSLYEEPYDETRPVICFDESSKALRKHVRDPLLASPGAVAPTITTTNVMGNECFTWQLSR